MRRSGKGALRRGLAIVTLLGLLLALAGTSDASAKTAACKKGFVRNKAKGCVRTTSTTTKKATTAKPATSGGTAPVASKATIKIGVIGTEVTRAGAAAPAEAKQISKAWADTVNAAGGINGYKFEVIYKAANGDPARALNAIKEFDKAGALAFTQGDAAILPALRDYMTKQSLAVIGGNPYTVEFDYDPMFFPVQAGQAAGVYGQVAAARDAGAKHFRNVYCSEVAACGTAAPQTKYAAEREGLKFSQEAASALAADYTANCLSAKSAGADFFQSNGLNFANVIRDCARQNYHPTYAQGGAANQAVIDAAKGENVAGNLFEFGIFYDGPEVQRFRQALARTDQKVSDGTATQTSVHTWLGLEMIGSIAKRMTAANPTRQDLLEAAYTVKGETLGGQIAPMDYTVQRPGTGKHAASDCWTEHLVKDGKLYHMDKSGQIVTKLTFICGTGLKYNDQKTPI